MPKFKHRNKYYKDNNFNEISLTKMAKRQLTITLCSIFCVTILTIGSAFSMFTTQAVGKEQVIKVGTLNIDFGEDADGSLDLTGSYPMEDEEGQETTPYTFTIKNTGTIEAYYTVKLEDDTEMIEKEFCAGNLIDKNQVEYSIDAGTPEILGNIEKNDNIIAKETLASGASKTYNLRLWIKNGAPNTVLNRHYHGKIVVEGVDKGAAPSAVKSLLQTYANSVSVQDYDINYTKEDPTAKENKMYVFNHKDNKGTQQSGWTDDELKDYRYIGKNPNNYVTFNNEVAGWRIIGIETVDDGTGKREKRIKLIRKNSLSPIMSWDNKPSGTGSSESENGSNWWGDSRLMMILNPGYDNNELATGGKGSLFWNRQSGNCPNGSNDASAICNFEEVGLLPESQKLIGDTKWYLGGVTDYTSVLNGISDHFYSYERGEETCTTKGNCTQTRKTNWTGKVGLMYPSDYGYATSGGINTNRQACLEKELHKWESLTDCSTNDWIYKSNENQWTITPHSGDSYRVFNINVESVYDAIVRVTLTVRPVVYLASNVQLLKGTGSESDPFEFGL